MDKQITIAANTNPNPLRAIMYETSAPNVAVQAIDIPLPHNVSQQIVFTGLNDVSHWFRLYEVVGLVLGTQLSDSLIQPTVKSVYCDLPIELNVGVAPTDRITPAVNSYNGTVEFPQYAGKVAKIDYWVEQRGVGQLKDDEYTNNTDMGVTFGFKLTGTALFNDADTYFIKFRPIILVNPANFPAARVELFTDIVLVNTSRTIDATYANKMMDVQSAGGNLTLTLDLLANMPNLKLFHFVNNFGLQTQTTIKAATGELIYFNGAEVNQIVLKMSEYLTLNKKGSRWYFVDGNVETQKGLTIHRVGDAGEPAYQNSWIPLGFPGSNLRFRRDISTNMIHFSGGIYKGTYTGATEEIFTLPLGYRPARDVFYTINADVNGTPDMVFHIFITASNGKVEIDRIGPIYTAAVFFASLEGLSFFTD